MDISAGGINFNQNLGGIYWSNNKYISTVLSNGKEWLTYKVPFGHEFFVGDKSCLRVTEEGISIMHVGTEYMYISNNNGSIWLKKPLFITTSGNIGYEGYPMIGQGSNHKYFVYWEGSQLNFFVDKTFVGNISDERLKSDFKKIDNNFLEAINELEIQQFKCKNRNDLISFGIIAQDLIKVFKKYNINQEDYEILQKVQYDLDNDEKYYTIDYIQFLVLKQLANDKKINKQQEELNQLKERDKQKDIIIQKLIHRIETIEKEKLNGKD